MSQTCKGPSPGAGQQGAGLELLEGVPVARRSMCTRKDVQRAALAFAKEHEDIEMYNSAESQARNNFCEGFS